jgi:hypothetical protein
MSESNPEFTKFQEDILKEIRKEMNCEFNEKTITAINKAISLTEKSKEEEELKWLKKNRDIIDGIDVLEVDKRIKELSKIQTPQLKSEFGNKGSHDLSNNSSPTSVENIQTSNKEFCNPYITIQEDSKEDFKELMGWTEQQFMEKVFVRLKGVPKKAEVGRKE